MSEVRPTTFVWPSFVARNASALVDFYVEAFGFTISAMYGDGDPVNHIDHCELLWPQGGGIMLGDEHSGGESERSRQPGTFSVYIVTDEPDALYERAIAAGATQVRGLNNTDYGSREFAVKDPEGNQWTFGTYRGADDAVR
jgi:uncharacterized glyoxalase superfamily protein PhnB